jgi:hypothetical protein
MAVYGRNMLWGRNVTNNKLHWSQKYIIRNKWYINATGCLNTIISYCKFVLYCTSLVLSELEHSCDNTKEWNLTKEEYSLSNRKMDWKKWVLFGKSIAVYVTWSFALLIYRYVLCNILFYLEVIHCIVQNPVWNVHAIMSLEFLLWAGYVQQTVLS